MQQLKTWWNEKPLAVIMILGFAFRLLASFFSKGFGFADDHFLIIEAAQSWIDHVDYDNWLPVADGHYREPGCGHNFFYPGLIYILFKGLKYISITDPQIKMTILRLLQVPYSMLTVYFGYKIAEKISTPKAAKQVGLMLAIMWLFPILSVRNLIEMMCIPPLIYGTWLALKDDNNSFSKYFTVGVFLALGFCFRFQSLIFVGGFGLALLFARKWLPAIATGMGFILCAGLIQGSIDMLIWHKPFVEFIDYITYNMHHAYNFVVLPWYMYVVFILGVFIPPLSIFIFSGYFMNIRKRLLLFLPSFLFLVFHSIFPNKRERFILPILPFVVILGYTNWVWFAARSAFWQKRQSVFKFALIFFWSLNTIPLIVLSTSYSKRHIVETMTWLYKKGDVVNLVIEDNPNDDNTHLPYYYLGKWITEYGVNSRIPIDTVYKRYHALPAAQQPNYVIFFKPDSLAKRMAKVSQYHTLKYEATIEPSVIDEVFHFLNPKFNENQTVYIYRITGDKLQKPD